MQGAQERELKWSNYLARFCEVSPRYAATLGQELFDAIVVNPYDDDAVADAIAALRQRLAHPGPRNPSESLAPWFPQS